MIYSVSVLNPSNNELIMELTNPEKSGFTIRKIDGIGPTKSNVNVYDVPSIDGGLFNSARTQYRNITMKLGYMWITTDNHRTPLIEDARHLSYKFFPLKRKVRLEFITDYRTLYIDGYIEANEPDIFSKDEVTDISIICPDPNFYATEEEHAYINYSRKKLFEFPFSNESLDEKLIEFSSLDRYDRCSINYKGDNQTGMTIDLLFHEEFSASQRIILACINDINSNRIVIDPTKIERKTKHKIHAGDFIRINSKPGKKSVEFYRLAETHNCFDCISLENDWPYLYPGKNTLIIKAGRSTDTIKGTITYNTLYDGV